jgi:ABC-2 type transport system ATP-binding protein
LSAAARTSAERQSAASANGQAGSAAIEARNIVHRYGVRTALDRFSLAVPRGSVFGLLGPNGSGKSTFLSLVIAMERPQEGSLAVFGEQPSAALRARTGAVFQENTSDPLMRAEEYLALAGRAFGLGGAALRDRTAEALETFGLSDRRRDAVAALSGGMRRRLEVARATLHRPRLLILDEPTTGIDPGERQLLWAALASEPGERTVVLATNDLAEADRVCDDVAFMKDGRVVTTGTPEELKRGLRAQSLRVEWPGLSDGDARRVGCLPGAGDVVVEDGALRITVDDAASFVPRLFALPENRVRAIEVREATLEDAYFRLVGQPSRARA